MKILVRYLPSDEGRAAVRAAVIEAQGRSAQLLLFRHVEVSEERAADDLTSARDELETLGERLRQDGVACDVHWSVGAGAEVRALLHLAEREAVDLLVLGVRRRSPVGKLVLGSATQDILLRADCPVLAVKASSAD